MLQADITSLITQTAFYAGFAAGLILGVAAALIAFKLYTKHDFIVREQNRKEIQQLKDENRKLQTFYDDKITKIHGEYDKQGDKFIENYQKFAQNYQRLSAEFNKHFAKNAKAD